MAEEQKPETPQTEETKSGKVVFESQEDFDAVIMRRLSKEREKFSDYEPTKAELEKLRQEKKEREEAELTESEKLKKQLQEKDDQIANLIIYKDKQEEWERRETEKIEQAMADLSDEDKDLVVSLPLDKRMAMINKLNPSNFEKPKSPTEKPFKFTNEKVPTAQEYLKIREEYGPESIEARRARELIKQNS